MMRLAKRLDDGSGRYPREGSRRGRNSQAKGLEPDKPLESRSIGADEASPQRAHLSGKQTEARLSGAPFSCTKLAPLPHFRATFVPGWTHGIAPAGVRLLSPSGERATPSRTASRTNLKHRKAWPKRPGFSVFRRQTARFSLFSSRSPGISQEIITLNEFSCCENVAL